MKHNSKKQNTANIEKRAGDSQVSLSDWLASHSSNDAGHRVLTIVPRNNSKWTLLSMQITPEGIFFNLTHYGRNKEIKAREAYFYTGTNDLKDIFDYKKQIKSY